MILEQSVVKVQVHGWFLLSGLRYNECVLRPGLQCDGDVFVIMTDHFEEVDLPLYEVSSLRFLR